MPKPPQRMEAQARNIDKQLLPSILTPPFTTKQDREARSLFSPQNFQERSPQISQCPNSAPS
ncbi:MAG TPA: hypothetical protein V6D09_09410, partial [Leptolyngbyaceae cyanobacterium]